MRSVKRSRQLGLLAGLLLCMAGVDIAAAAPWVASPEVMAAQPGAASTSVTGYVFEDLSGDGRRQPEEPGIPGVLVSNGLDVAVTDAAGAWTLPVRDDMNLFVVQPSGWRVPVDMRQVPQFFHVHKREGTSSPLRFGGLAPSGPPPMKVNFPLRRHSTGDTFNCAVLGDVQTYSNAEIAHFRDSVVADLLAHGPDHWDCLLYLGDVVGDDLELLPRLLALGASVGAPQYLVFGNHDMDFDAQSPSDSADSWRRLYGPQYYAWEMGQTLFVVLDNVVYPCGETDLQRPGRDFCGVPGQPAYNGRIDDIQMQWLENLLSRVPEDRLVVIATHIPLVSFTDARSRQHQTDNASELYALLEGRPALSLSGHTHTVENHAPGQAFAGWAEAVGVDSVPFRHIIAGAVSGAWWLGDFDIDGIPMALQRDGSPKGVLELTFAGATYRERYLAARLDPHRVQWLSFNTPAFRRWMTDIVEWSATPAAERDPLPPRSINDLPDPRLFTPRDLAEGVWLTVNVWAGSAETLVALRLNGAEVGHAERTQQGAGEEARAGAEWADPFATMRQLSVTRFALQSRSGEARHQGFEGFRGVGYGPGPAQPIPGPGGRARVTDRATHLWRWRLPDDLAPGAHRLEVTTTDRHGLSTRETLIFEVAESRPPPLWRRERWSRYEHDPQARQSAGAQLHSGQPASSQR